MEDSPLISRAEFYKLIDLMYKTVLLAYPGTYTLSLYTNFNQISEKSSFYFFSICIEGNNVVFSFTNLKLHLSSVYFIYILSEYKEKHPRFNELYRFLIKNDLLEEVSDVISSIFLQFL